MTGCRPLLPLALLAAAGCIPLPHSDQTFPAVAGRVERSGLAVAGARIYSAAAPEGPDCEGTELAGTTDEAGAFAIEPERDFRFFFVLGDPLAAWTVCIEHRGVRYVGWANHGIGLAPESVRMECDLADPVADRRGGRGLCRWEEDR